jgi:antitoxin component of MazEF toxin-antitoxin module
MNAILTLTSKNQLTLPVSFVKELQLIKGSKLIIELSGVNTLILTPTTTSWDTLQGSLSTHLLAKKSTADIIKIAKTNAAKNFLKKF